MNMASNCWATSRSASVTPSRIREGSSWEPSPMLVTARFRRCSDSKSKMDVCGPAEPGRGVNCTNDMPLPSDDFQVGAQCTGTFEILQNREKILWGCTKSVQGAHHVRQIGTGVHLLQCALF